MDIPGAKQEDYQPKWRSGHSTVRIGDHLYMWGGNVVDLPEDHTVEEKRRQLTSRIEVFDLATCKWEQKLTTGDPPLAIRDYASAAIGNDLFYFGGTCTCNYGSLYQNSLHCLNVSTLNWRELSPSTVANGHPSKKGYCGMVPVLLDGEHYLAVVGGFGPSANNTPHQPGAQYSEEGFQVINNEIHYYHLTTGHWSSPQVNGDRVTPCHGLTLTSLGDDSAILYGGSAADAVSNDDVYIMTFGKESLTSKRIAMPSDQSSTIWPIGREEHASALINSTSGPLLFVVGGYPDPNDSWLFDVNRATWTELILPKEVTKRFGHSVSAWGVPATAAWMIMVFGGWRDGTHVSDTTVIELTYSRERWSTGTVPLDQYQEKLREKRKRKT